MQSTHSTRHRPAGASQQPLSRMLRDALEAGLLQLAPGRGALPNEQLRLACRLALERVWGRREALMRALLRPPGPVALGALAAGRREGPHAAVQDEQVSELDAATTRSARTLIDAARAALPAHASGATPGHEHWPHSPERWALVLRRIAERAAAEHAVRVELMRLGTGLMSPLFVDSCRQELAPDDAAGVGHGGAAAPFAQTVDLELPVDDATGADASPTAEELVDALRPGFGFRMVLMDQWTDVRVTWRSENGRLFMLSSRLAGRAHSISRGNLQKLIERGHVRLPDAAPPVVGRSLR